MDYRNYRGDPPKLPPWLTRHLHLLRWLGGVMVFTAPVIGWLSVLKILQISFSWYFLGVCNMGVGMILFIIGLVFDNSIDRSK